MIITYQGSQSFKVQFGDFILSFDEKGIKQKSTGEKEGFQITGPGEYEIKEVFIKGLPSRGLEGGINTIYTVNLEGMNLCFLGALSDSNIPPDAKEAIDGVDILFAPVDTLGPSESYKFAVSLEPAIIIPMRYSDSSLKSFLKEGGEGSENMDKLTIKKKDLEGKEGEIIVLKNAGKNTE